MKTANTRSALPTTVMTSEYIELRRDMRHLAPATAWQQFCGCLFGGSSHAEALLAHGVDVVRRALMMLPVPESGGAAEATREVWSHMVLALGVRAGHIRLADIANRATFCEPFVTPAGSPEQALWRARHEALRASRPIMLGKRVNIQANYDAFDLLLWLACQPEHIRATFVVPKPVADSA